MMNKLLLFFFLCPTASAAWWPGMIFDEERLPAVSEDIEVEPWKLACMEIFEEILDIQDQREKLRKEMHNNVQLRKQRKLCRPLPRFFGLCNEELKYSRLFDKWLVTENKLATSVNARYIAADEAGCFAEVDQ